MTTDIENKNDSGSVLIKDLCEETLRTYLVYLNPLHITNLLIEWIEDIERIEKINFSNSNILKMIIHTAFAFERVIKGNPLVYSEKIDPELVQYLNKVESSISGVEKKIDLYLCEDEKLFVAEILREIC